MAGDAAPLRARERRNRVVLIGAIALLLVLVPMVLVVQRGYFKRIPALAREYEPWSTSPHAEVGCAECHVRPGVLTQTVYRTRMVGEFYLSLVARSHEPNVFAKPSNEACLKCHNDLRSVSPKGDLQIPHRAHVTVLKMNCVECHDYLVHELNPAGKHTPTMAGCLRCHDGDTAKNTCTACHTQKAAPESHQAKDWLIQHPQQAAGAECDSCHKWTDKWCADCHARKPASHTKEWRAIHGTAVKQHRSCEACHDGDFCVRCHGEVPQDNLNPSLKPVE